MKANLKPFKTFEFLYRGILPSHEGTFEVELYNASTGAWVLVHERRYQGGIGIEECFEQIATRIFRKNLAGVDPNRLKWIVALHDEETQELRYHRAPLNWDGERFIRAAFSAGLNRSALQSALTDS